MIEKIYKEACWALGIPFSPAFYTMFLESEEFKNLEMKLKATAYYEISNWLKDKGQE